MPGKGVLNPRPGDDASRGDLLGHGRGRLRTDGL